jgi:hypothetical protein
MSFWDKIRCATCKHTRIKHTGTHVRGSKTACRRCKCKRFRDPDLSWLR